MTDNKNFVALMKFSNGVKIAAWARSEESAQREIDRRRVEPLQYGADAATLVDARIASGEATLPYLERHFGNVFARHQFA